MYRTYTMERTIGFSYIDNRGLSRPSALFDLMQDAATEHAYALGIDKDSLNIFWVLSRMRAHQLRPFLPGETIRLTTVFSGVKGVTWYRSFTFEDASGLPLAQASSSWVMLEPDSHRMLRPKDVPAAAEFVAPPPADFEAPGKLGYGALTPHHVHTVRYSDLDVNRHLNNVKTVDLIADGLDLDCRDGFFVSDIQVNYTAECLRGENIALSCGTGADGMEYVLGRTEDAVKFEAAARLSPLES